jgi:hypothetical protein
VQRPELFFTLGDDHQVDRQLSPRRDDRVEGVEKGALGSLLIRRPARHQHFA